MEPLRPDDPEEARVLRAALVRGLAAEVKDARVLDALGRVPRHLFVPGVSLRRAYLDEAAPIGHGQTISQPTIVALMTAALNLEGHEHVLEIGTGSGYQAAVLSLLVAEVDTIEVVPGLANEARARIERLGHANVHVRAGDGYAGWPDRAPFDRIALTAAPDELPAALVEQLVDGGILVGPVGSGASGQELIRYTKTGAQLLRESLAAVRFVPMVRRD